MLQSLQKFDLLKKIIKDKRIKELRVEWCNKQMIHLLQTKKKILQSNCNSVYPRETLKIQSVKEYKQNPNTIYAHKKQL
jgi:hypothetical protein